MVNEGHLVTSFDHRDQDIIADWAHVLFEGLAALRNDQAARNLILEKGSNKDHLGRLRAGFFEKTVDDMRQLNIVNVHDDRIRDYRRNMPTDSYAKFFEALCELYTWVHIQVEAIGDAVDAYIKRERIRGNDVGGAYDLTDLLPDSDVLVSVTSYRVRAGASESSGCPNTAALGIYCLVKGNASMHVLDRYGRDVNLSHVEKDPSRILVVPGEELSLITNNLIMAATNPVYVNPEEEGLMRTTLRVFVYLPKEIMAKLRHLREEHNKGMQMLVE
ncbi:hypothetical protein HZC00_00995 [Candidatus Kaiserbacteria bacterium]|nr:hypothetical protein [Candidatus Kaiserbacteria bacterium]